MAPLLVTALVGVGVKLATDLLMAGAKELFGSKTGGASFASTLEKARSAPAPAGPAAGTKPVALDAGLADRSRMLAAEIGGGLPPAARAQGAEIYRKLADIAPQAI